ncbi:MAG: putative Fe-S cluster assembly protein SufT [Microthrixaceae bacterium]
MSPEWTPIALTRPITALTVPGGNELTLEEGTEVEVFQQLGNSITLLTEMGTLLRIQGSDADAVGLEAPEIPNASGDEPFDPSHVIAALRGVYDPEIPVNIIDLGLVYRCDEVPLDDDRRRIEIDMTMTAPGCGMGDVLAEDARRAVEAIHGVDEVEVTLVFDPPWDMTMMTEETRLELGLL